MKESQENNNHNIKTSVECELDAAVNGELFTKEIAQLHQLIQNLTDKFEEQRAQLDEKIGMIAWWTRLVRGKWMIRCHEWTHVKSISNLK